LVSAKGAAAKQQSAIGGVKLEIIVLNGELLN